MSEPTKDLGFLVGLLHAIAASHQGDVMLVGNVRAEQIVEICKHTVALAQRAEAAEAERANLLPHVRSIEAERKLVQEQVNNLLEERDALRKDAARFVVDDAMVERVARKLAERYSANVTTDEHDAWLLFQTSFMLEARCLIDAALAVQP